MEADAAAAETSVRYILVAFDKVPTIQNQNGAMGDGTVYMSELEVYGTGGKVPFRHQPRQKICSWSDSDAGYVLQKSETFVYDKFEEAGVDENGQPAFPY